MKEFFVNETNDLNELNPFNCCKYQLRSQAPDEDDEESISSDDEQFDNDNIFNREINENENDVETDLNENFEINISSLNNDTRIANSNDGYQKKNNKTMINYEKNWILVYASRYSSFMRSPKVLFFYDCVFFLSFLSLFSYMMLCDLSYYTMNNVQFYQSNNQTNLTFEPQPQYSIKTPSIIEWILIYWIISLFIDEIYQFLVSNMEGKFSYKFFR